MSPASAVLGLEVRVDDVDEVLWVGSILYADRRPPPSAVSDANRLRDALPGLTRPDPEYQGDGTRSITVKTITARQLQALVRPRAIVAATSS
jgi:hypothetical protein